MNRIQLIHFLKTFLFFSLSCQGQFQNSDGTVDLICNIEQVKGEWFLIVELKNISSGKIDLVVDKNIRTERPNRDIGVLVEPGYTAAGVVRPSSFCSLEIATVPSGDIKTVKKVKLSERPEKSFRVVFVVHEDFTKWFHTWSGALEFEVSEVYVETVQ
jgi:hypothetical protein